ncbi:MAG: 3-oxoacyl-ACP synthase III [Planctomycetota bacterium]|jgi:3-oxoacyl-[acyl-carrier-protein] synthase-3|nr:3-oxoacyl-ACP synthase III [Planctomycetota bacterium]MDP6764130.1 3-oxoacyl-ACP synthase III [Planctomycetota bacterium]MDP6989581.1 3-oxoacyl-ACP synthase III [Planctomycetota bacterium]
MRFEKVHLDSIAHALPEEVVTSAELEERLAPLYERLNLSVGRLELMSGIRERRFWPRGTRPSEAAARAGAAALERSDIARERIGCVIHASVCRDFLEPATASVVHRALELPASCPAFDLSNACLGFANAMVVAANMIEGGRIDAALVVTGEDGRPLVEETLARLSSDPAAGRGDLKRALASLTIGSGAAAAVLAHQSLSPSAPRLVVAASRSATEHVELCRGETEPGRAGPLMETDSEAMLHAGNALAAQTFDEFLTETGWTRDEIEGVVTHQVGVAHRRLLLETLALDPARDFPTVERLGNVGSASLPITYSLALDQGRLCAARRVALLGIGSGLQCCMLALEGPSGATLSDFRKI